MAGKRRNSVTSSAVSSAEKRDKVSMVFNGDHDTTGNDNLHDRTIKNESIISGISSKRKKSGTGNYLRVRTQHS